MKKIYLAIPYSGIEEESYALANEITVELLNRGFNVLSPITHSHPLSKVGKLPGNWDFWKNIDYQFIDFADMLVVVEFVENNNKINPKKVNYTNSVGVRAEINYAEKTGKPIAYLNPNFINNFVLNKNGTFYYKQREGIAL